MIFGPVTFENQSITNPPPSGGGEAAPKQLYASDCKGKKNKETISGNPRDWKISSGTGYGGASVRVADLASEDGGGVGGGAVGGVSPKETTGPGGCALRSNQKKSTSKTYYTS